MAAARTRLDTAAENLANVSSGGFTRTLVKGSLTPFGVALKLVRSPEHGGLTPTGRDWDLAIAGDGAFRVRDAAGRVVSTRDGAFVRERDGSFRDAAGRTLLDERDRPLVVPENARPDVRGRFVDGGRVVARLALPRGSSLHAGFLERPNVDAIAEMIDVMGAQRSFETAQKVVSAIDRVRERAAAAAAVK